MCDARPARALPALARALPALARALPALALALPALALAAPDGEGAGGAPPPLSPALAALFAAVWGASLASFGNVLIHRLPLGMSVVAPRSSCPRCGRLIPWRENLPILSYLALRGRCAGCRAPISPRYALVELAGAAWGVALGARWVWPVLSEPALWAPEPWRLWAAAGVWAWQMSFAVALIAVTFIDLEHLFIPDELSLPALLIGVWGAFTLAEWEPALSPLGSLAGAALGYALVVTLRVIGELLYGREAMGLGDAKLLAVIGAFLGWEALPFVLLLGALQGLLAAGAALLYTRLTGRPNALTLPEEELDAYFGEESPEGARGRVALPFGPFLCLAAFEVLAVGEEVMWSLG
ncbi:MAG: hypothetical protein FJ138_02675 [Deltaproteobacteria bacterium]|nr:hypothetical protein [Deltaproteobacteria bacterium]